MYSGKLGGSVMQRKIGKILGVLVLVLGLAVMGLAQTKTLTILHSNDTHSAMLPFTHQPYPAPFAWLWPDHRLGWLDQFRGPGGFNRDYAGIARMATLIKQIRMTRKNVLAFNTGDVFVGSFMFNKFLGYPEYKIMENLYDAMTPGNHEFDLGMDVLAGVLSGMIAGGPAVTLPILNANYNMAGHALAGLFQPSIVRTIDGVKVGIFGIGNEDPTNFSAEMIARFQGTDEKLSICAATQAGTLRAAGCKVVICLSHLGTMYDAELLSQVPGIDIIIGGHSHDLFDRADLRNGKIIVQAGSHGRWLGDLRVAINAAGGVRFLGWRTHELDKTVRPDPEVQAQLDVLQGLVEADPRFGLVFTEPVAYAVRNIDNEWPAKGPNRDAALGILVADAMKSALLASAVVPPIDCVLDPMGYTEFGIPAGKVVGNDILRAVPYGYDPASGLGFKLVVVPLDGQTILGLLEYTLTYVEYTRSLCVQPSGLTFAYDSSKPPAAGMGQISRLDPMSVKIGDELVVANQAKIYFIGMTDQVYKFLNTLTQGQISMKFDSGILEYNAVRDYVQSLGFVKYVSEGRVIDTAPATTAVFRRR
jgi:2',3'-cyclic-nucleotide 2'-phosphodiesterase (5'-nucleotidase family)